jgi:hypothetical protein
MSLRELARLEFADPAMGPGHSPHFCPNIVLSVNLIDTLYLLLRRLPDLMGRR